MTDQRVDRLLRLATDFRRAIERSIAEKANPHLPYFPDGACRLVSSILALHLSQRGFRAIRYRQAALPGPSAVLHAWLVVDGAVVDLTADSFGLPSVFVARASPFHDALGAGADEDALEVLAALAPDVTGRNLRFLVQIEARLPNTAGAA